MSRAWMSVLLALAACGPGRPSAPARRSSVPDHAAGVTSPPLAALLNDHWEWVLRRSPEWATTMGDHRYDDRIAEVSHAAVLAARGERRAFLDRARAIDRSGLAEADRITLDLLIFDLDSDAATDVCDDHLWGVSAGSELHNPVVRYNYLPERHRLDRPSDGRNLVARYQAVPAAVDDTIANLRRGLAGGLVASAEAVRRTLAMVDAQLAQPIESWALGGPARNPPAGWPEPERARFAADIRAAVAAIAPAYRRYRDLLATEVLPRARGADAEGIGGLGRGDACYRARIRQQTGLAREAAELHKLGRSEIARIDEEMRALGQRLLGTRDQAAILARLRADPALHFTSADEIVEAARSALAAAQAAVPRAFGRLPRAGCRVAVIPDYEAPFSTIAYYREPHADGSKPGEYFVNTYQPATRPRYEARVLAFHESVPGHHTQIALAMELGELPAFRRFGGNTAFIEGWALYTERLADELGLYPTDVDRMGMLSYDAWRASRLVVDTGLHAYGWTRQQAVDFMMAHTALAAGNIDNEVDRYIAWPGQALAYKVGQLEILRLRELARARLGERFRLPAFHDLVLGQGAVILPVLADQVDRWIASADQKK